MSIEEKIKIIVEYLTNDKNEQKRLFDEIKSSWFEVQIDSAVYNLLDNKGHGSIAV